MTPTGLGDVLLSPRHWPFYYGWVIVAIAFLGSGLATGVSLWGASVFVLPMTDELGWSRTAFFSAFAVRGAIIGVLSPVIGPFLDRREGARLIAIGSALLMGSSMVGLRFTEEVWQFVLLFGVAGGIADLGSGFMVSQTIVPKWFIYKRGRALGIAIAGVGLGATVFPGTVSALVDSVGWRDAWAYLGVFAGGTWLLLALLIWTRPEEIGLRPDGARVSSRAPAVARADVLEESSLTRREAVRSPAFWMLVTAFALAGFGIMGFQSNWLPFLLEQDFTAAEASTGILFYGVVSGVSRPLWGLLSERVSPRLLMTGSMVITGSGVMIFFRIGSLPTLIAYMIGAGVVMGGYLILQSLLTANYFGREHLGAVTSLMRPVAMATGALSPLLIGALYDARGDYILAFGAAAVAWVAAAAVVLLARPPAAREVRRSEAR